jgi:hypothetical protein
MLARTLEAALRIGFRQRQRLAVEDGRDRSSLDWSLATTHLELCWLDAAELLRRIGLS